MANYQTINVDDEREIAPPVKKGGFLKILLILLSLLLLIGASAGATMMLTGTLDAIPAGVRSGDGAESDRSRRPATRSGPPIYVELGEPFVVNFIEGNQIRYLQVRIEVSTRDNSIPQAISTHLPKIRNNLVFMFSGFDYMSLASVDGKQKIRDAALDEIQGILYEETGNPGVESVYFTSFVMQ
jgi:flagellar protein FliL